MSAGKGSSPRNCFSREWRDGWDRVFKKPKKKLSTLASRPLTQPTGRTVPPHP